MGEQVEFIVGTPVACSDGPCGEILRLVIDPRLRVLSYLVVEPKHRRGTGRLVPVDLVAVSNNEIRLHCTKQDFLKLSFAEETIFLSSDGNSSDERVGQMLLETQTGVGDLLGTFLPPVEYDTLPLGDVEVRRGERALAVDGNAGTVIGVVVDSDQHHLISVLLREGHLWRRRDVALPGSAVAGVDAGVRLNIAKEEVRHRSSTMSSRGCEQQMNTLPSAGGSTGSGL